VALPQCGSEAQSKLLDQAQEVLGYHRKTAVGSLRAVPVERGPWIRSGRPLTYEPGVLLPRLRPIWAAPDYACGRRLVAMLPEWVPAYAQHERRLPGEVRDKLLAASARTLDRLLEPLRGQGAGRSLTRPGRLLRQRIPIRESLSRGRNTVFSQPMRCRVLRPSQSVAKGTFTNTSRPERHTCERDPVQHPKNPMDLRPVPLQLGVGWRSSETRHFGEMRETPSAVPRTRRH
jgi:hypothetical protein